MYTTQELSYCTIKYRYRRVEDKLEVQLIGNIPKGMKEAYLKDAISEAYDDYNLHNPERALIQNRDSDI